MDIKEIIKKYDKFIKSWAVFFTFIGSLWFLSEAIKAIIIPIPDWGSFVMNFLIFISCIYLIIRSFVYHS